MLESVDEILRRLRTDYQYILPLHRPNALAESAEIDVMFVKLSSEVCAFGISNCRPMQIKLLKKYVKQVTS